MHEDVPHAAPHQREDVHERARDPKQRRGEELAALQQEHAELRQLHRAEEGELEAARAEKGAEEGDEEEEEEKDGLDILKSGAGRGLDDRFALKSKAMGMR